MITLINTITKTGGGRRINTNNVIAVAIGSTIGTIVTNGRGQISR